LIALPLHVQAAATNNQQPTQSYLVAAMAG